MGLVNGDHGNGGAFGKVQKFRGQQTLRRHIDDLVHSGLGVSQGGPVLAPAQGAVEIGPPHAVLYQGAHLVPHQRDQRGHHQSDALHQQGRHLIAQGFSRPRGHNSHRVPPGQQRVNQLLLPWTKGGVAKIFFQDL